MKRLLLAGAALAAAGFVLTYGSNYVVVNGQLIDDGGGVYSPRFCFLPNGPCLTPGDGGAIVITDGGSGIMDGGPPAGCIQVDAGLIYCPSSVVVKGNVTAQGFCLDGGGCLTSWPAATPQQWRQDTATDYTPIDAGIGITVASSTVDGTIIFDAGFGGALTTPDLFTGKIGSAATVLYVSLSAGASDSNACTSPGDGGCATIQGACNKIPTVYQAGWIVQIGLGNFPVGCWLNGRTPDPGNYNPTSDAGPFIAITGTRIQASATGAMTGLVSSATPGNGPGISGENSGPSNWATVTVPGAGWSTNGLVGLEFCMIDGGSAPECSQVASNTSTTATIQGVWPIGTPDGGEGFRIEAWGTYIDGGFNYPPGASGLRGGQVAGFPSSAFMLSNNGPGWGGGGYAAGFGNDEAANGIPGSGQSPFQNFAYREPPISIQNIGFAMGDMGIAVTVNGGYTDISHTTHSSGQLVQANADAQIQVISNYESLDSFGLWDVTVMPPQTAPNSGSTAGPSSPGGFLLAWGNYCTMVSSGDFSACYVVAASEVVSQNTMVESDGLQTEHGTEFSGTDATIDTMGNLYKGFVDGIADVSGASRAVIEIDADEVDLCGDYLFLDRQEIGLLHTGFGPTGHGNHIGISVSNGSKFYGGNSIVGLGDAGDYLIDQVVFTGAQLTGAMPQVIYNLSTDTGVYGENSGFTPAIMPGGFEYVSAIDAGSPGIMFAGAFCTPAGCFYDGGGGGGAQLWKQDSATDLTPVDAGVGITVASSTVEGTLFIDAGNFGALTVGVGGIVVNSAGVITQGTTEAESGFQGPNYLGCGDYGITITSSPCGDVTVLSEGPVQINEPVIVDAGASYFGGNVLVNGPLTAAYVDAGALCLDPSGVGSPICLVNTSGIWNFGSGSATETGTAAASLYVQTPEVIGNGGSITFESETATPSNGAYVFEPGITLADGGIALFCQDSACANPVVYVGLGGTHAVVVDGGFLALGPITGAAVDGGAEVYAASYCIAGGGCIASWPVSFTNPYQGSLVADAGVFNLVIADAGFFSNLNADAGYFATIDVTGGNSTFSSATFSFNSATEVIGQNSSKLCFDSSSLDCIYEDSPGNLLITQGQGKATLMQGQVVVDGGHTVLGQETANRIDAGFMYLANELYMAGGSQLTMGSASTISAPVATLSFTNSNLILSTGDINASYFQYNTVNSGEAVFSSKVIVDGGPLVSFAPIQTLGDAGDIDTNQHFQSHGTAPALLSVSISAAAITLPDAGKGSYIQGTDQAGVITLQFASSGPAVTNSEYLLEVKFASPFPDGGFTPMCSTSQGWAGNTFNQNCSALNFQCASLQTSAQNGFYVYIQNNYLNPASAGANAVAFDGGGAALICGIGYSVQGWSG